MKVRTSAARTAWLAAMVIPSLVFVAQEKPLTYTTDIEPIVKKNCLPCHLAENENPSLLNLDTYEMLMEGGEHEDIIVPGKPKESLFYVKLLDDPPDGQRMPRKRPALAEAEIAKVYRWIEQGAKK